MLGGLAAVAGTAAVGGAVRATGVLEEPARVTLLSVPRYDDRLPLRLKAAMERYPATLERIAGARVLVKPNLVEWSAEGRPVNTDPRMVMATVEALRLLGARHVTVGDGPGHYRDTQLVLEGSGMAAALRDVSAPWVDLNVDDVVDLPLHRPLSGLPTLPVASTVLAADLVVSVAKLKTHHWAGVTLSMKNLFGVVPGAALGWPKNPLHWAGIAECVVDLWQAVRPGFAIVDGIRAMEGDGPLMGTAVDLGVVALGDHLPAVDATCARLMGYRTWELPFLLRARTRGATITARRIEVLGDAVSGHAFARPPGW